MSKKHRFRRKTRAQYAALPYRIDAEGRAWIMLVTSRETRRWVVPKGWPIRGMTPHGVAALEAYEEAGLVGAIGERAIGFYFYHKRLKDGSTTPCSVEVYPLRVERQLERWPERRERQGRWFEPEEAAGLVAEESLGALIRSFGEARAAA